MRGFRLCVLAVATFVAVAALPACKTARTPTPTVTIDTGERKVPFKVELAVTPAEHERGLMYREHLDADAGMLFISESPRRQVFWMKNTLIPLDMIFIGADWRIAGIVENAEPKTLSSREVAAPSQYVLEIGGGLSARYGIRAGQLVDFQAGNAAK
ncbi:MAG TPA: DUF192 domain-containing protein [Polyangia bacterium]|jgi:uncharacterized membrane protein (UPF0127 family)